MEFVQEQTVSNKNRLEGRDPAVRKASSLIDYTVRHLAANYLGRRDLPDPEMEETDIAGDTSPLLPMDLPAEGSPRARRRGFRVVGK